MEGVAVTAAAASTSASAGFAGSRETQCGDSRTIFWRLGLSDATGKYQSHTHTNHGEIGWCTPPSASSARRFSIPAPRVALCAFDLQKPTVIRTPGHQAFAHGDGDTYNWHDHAHPLHTFPHSAHGPRRVPYTLHARFHAARY